MGIREVFPHHILCLDAVINSDETAFSHAGVHSGLNHSLRAEREAGLTGFFASLPEAAQPNIFFDMKQSRSQGHQQRLLTTTEARMLFMWPLKVVDREST